MKTILLLLFVTVSMSCTQSKQAIKDGTAWQKKMNADFKDASKSPLKPKDREVFVGLDFFNFDTAYVVTASLKRTPDTEWFEMKTTTDRRSLERVYGVLSFELNGTSFELNVYQGKELMTEEGFENYLFLPFLDNTNGNSTYGGGRYIDLNIPEGDTMTIDFNTAYNPYCAYNEKFSCPIVPRVNYLDTDVNAGVKKFVKQ
ncbi:DUF1684 domain-containing protein [Winogradskyella eckloniae]|uniref:DUF1684 domain-containing protein n=1 Tax=Winogradskyella eckloniae TaxID=1089306 RepID=UPI00156340A5|nr:DUF1684 domain-containing protein [Winogradskyella eckloniae]NRD19582.1 DUF1684 domain-containing protein [Winogradskyella eckloniae]